MVSKRNKKNQCHPRGDTKYRLNVGDLGKYAAKLHTVLCQTPACAGATKRNGKFLILFALLTLIACSVNPATGKKQFAALMSPQQELKVGTEEHQKIIKQFGEYTKGGLQDYVRQVGAKVTQNTERNDVQYKFYVIDSPIVNAFALPGGYIYVSRGLLALANNEAELAAVLAHETGHITGRHAAERYSHGVITSLGAAVISAAVDSSGVSNALGVGSNLYMSGYSRTQESEADTLGLRYMSRGGYDVKAMAAFLTSLQMQDSLDSQIEGKGGSDFSYFSTHPATQERVMKTSTEASAYPQGGIVNRDQYLRAINGITYGDSPDQGLIKGQNFYHPIMGFGFNVPAGFRLINQPSQVIATSDSGAVMVFDIANSSADAYSYLTQNWMKGEVKDAEKITINGMNAATARMNGSVNGKPVVIQLIAIQWNSSHIARFQIAIPQNASPALIDDLKRASYSFHRLTDHEKKSIKPYTLHIINAGQGDNVSSLAYKMGFDDLQEQRFRVLNALPPGQDVIAGQSYKVIIN